MATFRYKFDVINYSTISNPELLAHINRGGVLFFKKSAIQIT